MSYEDDAWTAAKAIGERIGVDAPILYGQFNAETGHGKTVHGVHNYGNIKGGDPYVECQTVDDFVELFVHTIERDFEKAKDAGADVAKYVYGLWHGRLGAWAEVTMSHYAAMIEGQMRRYPPPPEEEARG